VAEPGHGRASFRRRPFWPVRGTGFCSSRGHGAAIARGLPC
jgi:hypothetical protein